jgi:AsmA protein
MRHAATRPLLRLATVLLAGVGLLVLALFALQLSGQLAREMDEQLAHLSERLGREVHAEQVTVKLLPRPRVRLRGLTVAGAPGDPPTLRATEVGASLRVLPLLTHRGKRLEVTRLELEGVSLRLVRDADGTWEWHTLQRNLLQHPRRPPGEGTPRRHRRVVWLVGVHARDLRLEVVDRRAGGVPALTLYPLDVDTGEVAPGRPLQLDVRASFPGEAAAILLSLRVDPLPDNWRALRTPGDWPGVQGTLRTRALPLTDLRPLLPAGLHAMVHAGTLDLDADVTSGPGRYVVSGRARMDGLAVHGQVLQAGMSVQLETVPGRWGDALLRLGDVSLEGPGVALHGDALLEHAPTRLRFRLEGPQLDLTGLLDARPLHPRADAAQAAAVHLPDSTQERLRRVVLSGAVKADALRVGALDGTALEADISLQDGVLSVERARVQAYGGRLAADGSRADFTTPRPSWRLRARMEAVEVGPPLEALGGQRVPPLQGTASGQLTVGGDLVRGPDLRTSLAGGGQLTLEDVALALDLEGSLSRWPGWRRSPPASRWSTEPW